MKLKKIRLKTETYRGYHIYFDKFIDKFGTSWVLATSNLKYHDGSKNIVDSSAKNKNLAFIDIKKRIKSLTSAKDVLKGGKADGLSDHLFNKKHLKMGIKVESEHTKSKQIQKEIAKDHIVESDTYYPDLKKIHKD
jgi:phosphoribosylformylglycinamidine (FGAM) synthase-like enzyme